MKDPTERRRPYKQQSAQRSSDLYMVDNSQEDMKYILKVIRGCRGDCDGKTYKVASLALAACIGSVLIDCCWDSGVEKNYRTLA
ncbi:Hypothetical protein SMAX5B_014601 [Scophthalmus maximus]|uniref:Uncharacterized protein n=1 Tax=Scophthalmus maximus TaxID=52904 RepID=A0A2U9C003_SCOMX|nr:Hypothetical protein SMAX5B_014601 [Scophthalmus maximus]